MSVPLDQSHRTCSFFIVKLVLHNFPSRNLVNSQSLNKSPQLRLFTAWSSVTISEKSQYPHGGVAILVHIFIDHNRVNVVNLDFANLFLPNYQSTIFSLKSLPFKLHRRWKRKNARNLSSREIITLNTSAETTFKTIEIHEFAWNLRSDCVTFIKLTSQQLSNLQWHVKDLNFQIRTKTKNSISFLGMTN